MFHLVPSFCWCKQVTNAPTFHCAIEHVIRKASLPTVLLFQRIFRPGSGSPQEKKGRGQLGDLAVKVIFFRVLRGNQLGQVERRLKVQALCFG